MSEAVAGTSLDSYRELLRQTDPDIYDALLRGRKTPKSPASS